MLKLNPDKTELILFYSELSPALRFPSSQSGTLLNLSPSSYVKSLGVYLDWSLSITKKVDSIAKSCYVHIRKTGRIHRHLSAKSCESLVHALVRLHRDSTIAMLYAMAYRIRCWSVCNMYKISPQG
ncbi:uncharacterized protein LOC143462707 [Clavelina lepadiformis]|uniref:uncharacterized protein LOC143462707 n=1 Tax=Clavelina lepadiformis TaxID=159417 RepID=UPI004042E248